ncbi:caspase family protein [Granulosicoccus sp. 3-233]|uniref:caspase family protein n=1 Tax=Granulosicoccus sp. 3-233 TaxID=3417969 RepID=UPI003D32C5F2
MNRNTPSPMVAENEQDKLSELPQGSPLMEEDQPAEDLSGFKGSPELDESSETNSTTGSGGGDEESLQGSPLIESSPDKEVPTEPQRAGSRRALCIGINTYPVSPLRGCVNDAGRWHDWFQDNGFLTEPVLTDAAATREGILEAIRRLVSSCVAGDVIAIQYSGHGTQLPDLNGDEASGDTPGLDEALVPVDHHRSGFILDDDIGDICNGIPAGANVTLIMDCCHSGTNSRAMFNSPMSHALADARPRFLQADAEMVAVHLRTQSAQSGSRTISQRSAEEQQEISFAACLSSQLAWESNDQGDFTRNALGVLQQQGIGKMTHDEFLKKVRDAFPGNARQSPMLSCSEQYRQHVLFGSRM